MNKMSKWIGVSSLGLFVSLIALRAAPQAAKPTSIPNGLPSWAYNIPDKEQPPLPKLTGTIHVPASGKEYDASPVRSTTNPPDWFPDEHHAAPSIVQAQHAPHAAPAAPSQSAIASSKRRSIRRRHLFAILTPRLSLTCRPAASPKVKRSLKRAAPAKPFNARSAMAMI